MTGFCDFALFSFLDWHKFICIRLNSSSTHIGALQARKRGMAYLGACKRLKSGFMMMVMMKLYMLILLN